MNLQRTNLNRLDVARRDLSDLKGLRPLVATAHINVQVCLHNEIHHIIITFITLHHPGR